jgi:hypothetical protein
MEQREPEPGGDYGYDLAHDTSHRAARGTSARSPGGGAKTSTTHAGGTSDRGEDLAYDEAHDF